MHDTSEEVQRVHDRLQLFEHHVDLIKQAMAAAQVAQRSAQRLGQAKQRAANAAAARDELHLVVELASQGRQHAHLGLEQAQDAASRFQEVGLLYLWHLLYALAGLIQQSCCL